MPTPQPGIFALGTRYHYHLEFDLLDGVEQGAIFEAFDALREPHVTAGATSMVIGFGSEMWQRLCSPVPDGLGRFEEVVGCDGHAAPATQHDMWVWVHGSGTDEVLDSIWAVAGALGKVSTVAADTSSFVYHDSRDLTGFIDGSANPSPSEAPGVACIPDGRPGAGGSHVLVQSWVHNLAAFNKLEVEDQERVFGRTKLDSIALPPDVRPADAHITLAEIHDDAGEERPIYRRSTPHATMTEQGLLFVAFSAERDRFDEMLAAMFGTGGRTIRDRLLDFSTAVSGAYYFAPSLDELLALGVADT